MRSQTDCGHVIRSFSLRRPRLRVRDPAYPERPTGERESRCSPRCGRIATDIAIPPFPPGITWIGGDEPVSERLTARAALLVHFFELGELSSIRTLPFVAALADRYGATVSSVLGVHSPRSALAGSDAALGPASPGSTSRSRSPTTASSGSGTPTAAEGWPSTFLWGRGGTLRWAQFGEGAYHETEAEVQGGAAPAATGHDLPEPRSIRARRTRAARSDARATRSSRAAARPALAPGAGRAAEVEYAGGGAWAALDGAGTVELAWTAGRARDRGSTAPGLYELAGQPGPRDARGAHRARRPDQGLVGLAFAPGAAATELAGASRRSARLPAASSTRISLRQHEAHVLVDRAQLGDVVGAALAEELDELGRPAPRERWRRR